MGRIPSPRWGTLLYRQARPAVSALHPKSGAGAVIRTLCASFGGWLLSQEHPGFGRGRRNRTPLARHQSTAFEAARRPFTGALCTSKLVPEERLALSLPKELVSKTSAYSFRHPGMEHRSGLEPDKSGFAIRRLDRFGIQSLYNNKLWLGRKDSNLRTLGSEPSAVAAVLLPNMRFGCGTRYRAELSAFSEQRFHLISFPAANRPPSSILVSGCRMSRCDGRTWRARGKSNPRRGIDSAPS